MIPVNPDSGAELSLAHWLLEEASIPADNGMRRYVAECIRMEAKRLGDVEKAASFILERALEDKSAGIKIEYFWFRGQKYKDGLPAIAQPEAPSVRESAERRAREMWESMSDSYKAQHPWGAKA